MFRSAAIATSFIFVATAGHAEEFEIRDAVAKVVVEPQARGDIDVVIKPGTAALPALVVRHSGGKVIVDGGLSRRIDGCRSGGGVDWHNPLHPSETTRVHVRDAGDVALSEAPTVYVKVPLDAQVSGSGAVFGAISRSKTLVLSAGGCGDWTVANVEGAAKLNLGGSGNVRAGNLGSLEVALGGSGDVFAANVGSLKVAIGGSGDVAINRVEGPIDVAIGGSGDVKIAEGRAPNLKVAIAGSGDVRFGGEAGEVQATVIGSGDIRVARASGPVHKVVLGSGDIIIGH